MLDIKIDPKTKEIILYSRIKNKTYPVTRAAALKRYLSQNTSACAGIWTSTSSKTKLYAIGEWTINEHSSL